MFRLKRATCLKQLLCESRMSFNHCRYFTTLSAKQRSVESDYSLTSANIENIDPEINSVIESEKSRLSQSILLSPTSNYAARPVLDTLQTVLQNKYSEGYPHARYYGGNENVDNAEELTQKRALQLFNLDNIEWKVNVQPLDTYNAIFEVLTALTSPSARIMTPFNNQSSSKQSAINKFFQILRYDPKNTTNLSDLANNYEPNLIISGNGVDAPYNEWNYECISKTAKCIHAYHLCDISDIAGLIVAGLAVSPFEYSDVVVCTPFPTLRGPRGAAMIFYRAEFAAKIDSAVFPGHQGGPHNHAISAMATSLKMAMTDEFIGYQQRVIQNATAMQNALDNKNIVNTNNGHCVLFGGGVCDMDVVDYEVANQVNVELFYDASMNEFRLSSNAMTTRGLNGDDFKEIIDYLGDIKVLANNVRQNGMDKHQNDIQGLKSEIGNFAKQFPVIGIDDN